MAEDFVFADIGELLEHLAQEHTDEYVYRGQSRDYEHLFPSRYRSLVEKPDEHGYAIIRRSRLIAERTLRTVEIDRLRTYLISKYNPTIGNLLCQQYAVYSTIIDTTSAPNVAAFFASRKWPGCIHIDEAERPGVVYRWNRTSLPTDQIGPHQAWRSGTFHASSDVGERNAVFSTVPPKSPESKVVLERPNGILTVPADIVTIDGIRTLLSGLTDETYPGRTATRRIESVWDGLRSFEQSRWAAQDGGMLRPEMTYECYRLDLGAAYSTKDARDGNWLERKLETAGVFIEEPFRVRDALKSPQVEKFYFRQSAYRVDIEPRTLWPGPEVDGLFMAVCNLVWVGNSDYLDDTRVNTPWDRFGGLLDRGIYAEMDADSVNSYAEYVEWCEARGLQPEPR